jgi:regulatory protein
VDSTRVVRRVTATLCFTQTMPFGKSQKPFQRKYKTAAEREAARVARLARINTSPGRVTAIEPQVKRPNRFTLYIDDHFAMGLSVYALAGVRVGQDMTRADLEKLLRAEQLEEAREKALRFLEIRPRSEQELRRALQKKRYPEEIISEVLTRLGDVKLVDDRDFATFWVENREGFKPRSKRALQYELHQKGVSSEEIARAVKQVDERDSAYRAAHSKALRYKDLDAQSFREKLSGFLARRGFDYAVTRETVKRLWQEVSGSNENLKPDWEIE